MAGGVELLSTPEPHFIPGYLGYLPQYRFRCGGTYGILSHELLVDPSVDRSSVLIVDSRTSEDSEAFLPSKHDIKVVHDRRKRTDPVYVHHMLPGYEGFVPRAQSMSGQRFGVTATTALAEFEREQVKQRQDRAEFKNKLFLENEQRESKPISKKHIEEDSECRCFDMLKTPLKINMECDLKRYQKMLKTTGGPSEGQAQIQPPISIQPTGIYPKHTGIIPNYLGHVPGAAFRIGKTFAVATKNAKQWLI